MAERLRGSKLLASEIPLDIRIVVKFILKAKQRTGCWLWLGAKDKDGYGELTFLGSRFRASALSYRIFNGLVPLDKFVLHSCDNTSCVNPNHLRLGVNIDNCADIVARRRRKKLTLEQESEIRSLRASGSLTEILRKAFQVSNSTVSRVTNGQR